MNGIERKMIELSNNSPLTRTTCQTITAGMSSDQLHAFERWLDHAIRETNQRETRLVRAANGRSRW